MPGSDSFEELRKERGYLADRLEEASSELTRLDVQNLALSLQYRQALGAFHFIRVLHGQAERASTVAELHASAVRAVATDLSTDVAALFWLELETGGVRFLTSMGMGEIGDGVSLRRAIREEDAATPVYVNSRTGLSAFQESVRTCLGVPYFVWHPLAVKEGRILVLFGGNRSEDMMLRQPFSDASLETFGAIASVMALRRDSIVSTQETIRQKDERIEFLAEIVNTSPLSVIATDSRGTIVYVNPATERLYGYRSEELVGHVPALINAEPNPEQVQRRIIGTVRRKGVWTGEILNRKQNGDVFYIHSSIFQLLDQSGNFTAMVGFQEDITAHKEAEEALRQSEGKYRDLADLLPQVVCEMDLSGNLVFTNRNAFEAFGYTQADFENGLNVLQMVAPEDRDRARANIKQSIQGEVREGREYAARRKDGSKFPMVVYTSPVMEGDRPTGLRAIVIDITERKQLEEELQRVQRLESLGVLAGGIAHDFNNILTSVLGNVSLAKMELGQDHRAAARLTRAENASLQAKELTEQLLTFAKGGAPARERIAIGELLETTADFASRGTSVQCELSIPGDVWPVVADAGQITQVISNLVINAKQAMPQGGSIRVRASNTVVGVDDGLPLQDGEYVVVCVEDSGIGIPQEHLGKIFDPYFTTKQDGSGLGLASSHSIVQKHEGLITVESSLGVGSSFFVYLPAAEEKFLAEPHRPEGISHGEGRVLVMDDEEMVRDTAHAILTEIGYEVTVAGDGAEAVDLYREAATSGEPYDAVVMDLTVPGGTGGQACIDELRKIDPNVRALVSSGYASDSVLSRYKDHGFCGVVAKPYRASELGEALARCLKG